MAIGTDNVPLDAREREEAGKLIDYAVAEEHRERGAADPIQAAMERAREVDWLTPEQLAKSDEALARLRRGEARLVREEDRAAALAEIAGGVPLDLDAIEARATRATPIEDTGHSQTCTCEACGVVWAHAAGLADARALVIDRDVPALVAEVRRLCGALERAGLDLDSIRTEVARLSEEGHEIVGAVIARGQELDRAREEARLWKALAHARSRMIVASDRIVASAHGEGISSDLIRERNEILMVEVMPAREALRAAGIDPDAP